jgi:hypothetical protein
MRFDKACLGILCLDPNIVGCVNNAATFRGSAAGGVCNWIVSAQAPGCAR